MSSYPPPSNSDRPTGDPPTLAGDIPARALQIARTLHSMRSARQVMIPGLLLGEPAWDMLLGLYIAQGLNYPLKVSDACFESRVPFTTGLRWIQVLEREGLVVRRRHGFDQRVILIELTQKGTEMLTNYFFTVETYLFRN